MVAFPACAIQHGFRCGAGSVPGSKNPAICQPSVMGMRLAFKPNADFSGMTPRRELFIGDVIHGAAISVDEAGTEATGATAIEVLTTVQ
jgi:hypothetical protein